MNCLSLKGYNFECSVCERVVSKGGYNFSKEGRSEHAIFICHRCFSEMKHSAEILNIKVETDG